MRIKSYFADSIQEAIEKARTELGPDAMLMNSKKTDFELRALGSVEVVFGLPGQALSTRPRLESTSASVRLEGSSPLPDRATDASSAASGEMAQDLADLRRQIETVKRSLTRHQRSSSKGEEGRNVAAMNVCSRLLSADLSEDLSQEIAEAVELQAFAWKQDGSRGMRDFEMTLSESIDLALSAELEKRFQVCPELGVSGAAQKCVMFVGPAGAGKTTSLVKLALRCGLQARLPMHIFSLDTFRVGGWEHLAAYARIAGLSFDAVHSFTALEQLLVQHAKKKLVLIDTPGFGPADLDDLNNLGNWVSKSNFLDVQLVIPATLSPSLMTRTLQRFSPLKPSKLLLTRADEIESAGVLLDLAMRSGLPLSYISNGQTVPEDLQQPSKTDLLARLDLKSSRGRREAA